MEKIINKDVHITITNDELIQAFIIPNDPENEYFMIATGMLKEALAIARPKYMYCTAAVEEEGDNFVIIEGNKFISPLLRKNLENVRQIIPYVATCGNEVDAWSMQFTDMLEHFWADIIKETILYKTVEVMVSTIREQFFAMDDMSHMNPGSLPEWPITEQKTLFGLMGSVNVDIGVSLTESCLMIPSKSVSGFYFSHKTHYENCQLCPRVSCPNRKAM
ncbi:MAG: vitamin B12 dependent-methionine synthase activation domain-containing protein [Christensenellales bacterium]